MFFLFQLLFIACFVAMSPWYLVKMLRRGNFAQGFWQRFGIFSADVRRRIGDGGGIWIHACSVGETRLALLFIQKLRQQWPNVPIALSTTTSTGQALARKLSPPDVLVFYYPLDFYPCVSSALNALRPRMLLLVETELWPGLVLMCRQRSIPSVVINGRMSAKSFRGYGRLRSLSRRLFSSLDLVCAQGSLDADRYTKLGVAADRIYITGSIKFDEAQQPSKVRAQAQQFLADCGVDDSRLVWVCGSTFAGEEEIVCVVFKRLRTKFPNLFLVLAPRHPERTRQVQAVAQRLGLHLALRTEAGRLGADGVLLNTTGELKAFYEMAGLIFVGKSLCGRGGQNIIEAAATGAPVLFGPQMQNFEAVAAAFVSANAAVQVRDEEELQSALEELIAKPQRRAELGERAKEVILRNCGAADRTLVALEKFLK